MWGEDILDRLLSDGVKNGDTIAFAWCHSAAANDGVPHTPSYVSERLYNERRINVTIKAATPNVNIWGDGRVTLFPTLPNGSLDMNNGGKWETYNYREGKIK